MKEPFLPTTRLTAIRVPILRLPDKLRKAIAHTHRSSHPPINARSLPPTPKERKNQHRRNAQQVPVNSILPQRAVVSDYVPGGRVVDDAPAVGIPFVELEVGVEVVC